MRKLPILSGRGLIRILNKLGYREIRQRGSHIRLFCPKRNPITVPDHRSIDRSLLRKILRDAELSLEDFQDLLD